MIICFLFFTVYKLFNEIICKLISQFKDFLRLSLHDWHIMFSNISWNGKNLNKQVNYVFMHAYFFKLLLLNIVSKFVLYFKYFNHVRPWSLQTAVTPDFVKFMKKKFCIRAWNLLQNGIINGNTLWNLVDP